MGFAERAVSACDRAMENGTLSERHVRDVLRVEDVDVQCLARHMFSENPIVRRAVARIIGKRGDPEPLVSRFSAEEDPEVLREFMSAIGTRSDNKANILERMINSDDGLVREEAISMLRRAGRTNSLFPLLFDKDELLVKRVKRYINEKKREHTEDPIS